MTEIITCSFDGLAVVSFLVNCTELRNTRNNNPPQIAFRDNFTTKSSEIQ